MAQEALQPGLACMAQQVWNCPSTLTLPDMVATCTGTVAPPFLWPSKAGVGVELSTSRLGSRPGMYFLFLLLLFFLFAVPCGWTPGRSCTPDLWWYCSCAGHLTDNRACMATPQLQGSECWPSLADRHRGRWWRSPLSTQIGPCGGLQQIHDESLMPLCMPLHWCCHVGHARRPLVCSFTLNRHSEQTCFLTCPPKCPKHTAP